MADKIEVLYHIQDFHASPPRGCGKSTSMISTQLKMNLSIALDALQVPIVPGKQ